jgi:hypothetical protein
VIGEFQCQLIVHTTELSEIRIIFPDRVDSQGSCQPWQIFGGRRALVLISTAMD